ncbi:MAG: hypothetical protein VR64_03410 [Desulfatitalea sp. BRH_c12]|nr:MAG: hypothetical protein VR64_03410 [Desulfatitalea sp. BRH_c12]
MSKKKKRKLTKAEKREKDRRREEFEIIFINGKQKRVRRAPKINGLDVDEFTRRNADPIWLHKNEMWEYITGPQEMKEGSDTCVEKHALDEDGVLPF